MQDKNTLINSMNNLINHISISRRNQQQMFSSLGRKDFDKIISNLDDSLLKLRITTVKLLTQLLYNNQTLKHKFCELMNIPFHRNSNIVLNGNLQKILEKYQNKELQLFTLLKQHANSLKQVQTERRYKQYLLWYINPKNIKLTVEYIQREEFAVISNFTNKNLSFDPLDCIFGVSLYAHDQQQGYGKSAISLAATTDASKVKTVVQNKELESPQDSFINKSHQTSYQKQINYQPVYIPMSAKSTGFSKQNINKIGNYSFTSGSTQAPNQVKTNFREPIKPIKQQQPLNMSYQTPHYIHAPVQSSTISTSKKQNEERFSKQNQKYSNRLSLQFNDYKGVRKVNQFQPQLCINNNSQVHRNQTTTQPNEHMHGIKLLTPRQSLRQGLKIPVSGAQTERMNTERQNTVTSVTERQKVNQYMGQSGQRIKTIHLGGFRGIESARQKRNVRIQRH